MKLALKAPPPPAVPRYEYPLFRRRRETLEYRLERARHDGWVAGYEAAVREMRELLDR